MKGSRDTCLLNTEIIWSILLIDDMTQVIPTNRGVLSKGYCFIHQGTILGHYTVSNEEWSRSFLKAV
jgi:hypothetical protein